MKRTTLGRRPRTPQPDDKEPLARVAAPRPMVASACRRVRCIGFMGKKMTLNQSLHQRRQSVGVP